LIIGDKYDVSNKDEEDEVAGEDVDFLGIIERRNWDVECHDDEAKHHLIDKNEIKDKIDSVDLKAKYFEASMVIFS
jgi:hypothetical protein